MLNRIIIVGFIFFSVSSAVYAQEDIGCCEQYSKESNVLRTQNLSETECTKSKDVLDLEKVNWLSNKRALGAKCVEKLDTKTSDSGEATTFTPQVTVPDSDYIAGNTITLAENTKPLAEYVIAIFKYSIGVIGIISAIVLMYGGVRWLTAAGNSSAVSDAKTYILSSLTGLILTFGSFLLLSTINTNLTNLKITEVKRIQYLGLNFGCCKKTAQDGSVTTQNLSPENCDLIKQEQVNPNGFKSVEFFLDQEALNNTCEPIKGCCQITHKATNTDVKAFDAEKPYDCKYSSLKQKINLPGGELISDLEMVFTFKRGYVAETDLGLQIKCVKGSQTAQQESGCINTNETGCLTTSDCCSGLQCQNSPNGMKCVAAN